MLLLFGSQLVSLFFVVPLKYFQFFLFYNAINLPSSLEPNLYRPFTMRLGHLGISNRMPTGSLHTQVDMEQLCPNPGTQFSQRINSVYNVQLSLKLTHTYLLLIQHISCKFPSETFLLPFHLSYWYRKYRYYHYFTVNVVHWSLTLGKHSLRDSYIQFT